MDLKGLSDTLDAKELEPYFRQFLDTYAPKARNKTALQELYELAYRQWDTYEPLASSLAGELTEYLLASVNLHSAEQTELLLSIVENLSLKPVFDYLIRQKDRVQNPAVRSLLEEAENDYSDTIGNPFDLIQNGR